MVASEEEIMAVIESRVDANDTKLDHLTNQLHDLSNSVNSMKESLEHLLKSFGFSGEEELLIPFEIDEADNSDSLVFQGEEEMNVTAENYPVIDLELTNSIPATSVDLGMKLQTTAREKEVPVQITDLGSTNLSTMVSVNTSQFTFMSNQVLPITHFDYSSLRQEDTLLLFPYLKPPKPPDSSNNSMIHYNSLLIFGCAHNLLDEMLEPNINGWSAMILLVSSTQLDRDAAINVLSYSKPPNSDSKPPKPPDYSNFDKPISYSKPSDSTNLEHFHLINSNSRIPKDARKVFDKSPAPIFRNQVVLIMWYLYKGVVTCEFLLDSIQFINTDTLNGFSDLIPPKPPDCTNTSMVYSNVYSTSFSNSTSPETKLFSAPYFLPTLYPHNSIFYPKLLFHDYQIKIRFENGLRHNYWMNLYSKYGVFWDAQKLFDASPKPDHVNWVAGVDWGSCIFTSHIEVGLRMLIWFFISIVMRHLSFKNCAKSSTNHALHMEYIIACSKPKGCLCSSRGCCCVFVARMIEAEMYEFLGYGNLNAKHVNMDYLFIDMLLLFILVYWSVLNMIMPNKISLGVSHVDHMSSLQLVSISHIVIVGHLGPLLKYTSPFNSLSQLAKGVHILLSAEAYKWNFIHSVLMHVVDFWRVNQQRRGHGNLMSHEESLFYVKHQDTLHFAFWNLGTISVKVIQTKIQEDAKAIRTRYSNFRLEDKPIFHGGGIDRERIS